MNASRHGGAGAGLAAVLALAASTVCADPAAQRPDHEAGVPLTPAEAAGTWTIESGGRSLCMIELETRPVAGGYAAKVPRACAEVLPAGVSGWASAPGGMSLIGADGAPVLGFGRWSNSLFVSHRSSGVDIQLKRGGPNNAPPGAAAPGD
jgi:hypothetical protein